MIQSFYDEIHSKKAALLPVVVVTLIERVIVSI